MSVENKKKQKKKKKMARSRFSGSLISPKVDLRIDLGNPFLNHTVDAFLKIGTVNFHFHFFVFDLVKMGLLYFFPNFRLLLPKLLLKKLMG